MASIVDVAKLAKVSVATVSRILNDERNVAPATMQKVEAAIKELGYVPRAVRPGPKPKNRRGINTGTIAFISMGSFSPLEMYRMPAFPALLGGIQRGIERNGLELVLAHMPEAKMIPPVLARRRADGVVLFGGEELSPQLKQAVQLVPAVRVLLQDGYAGCAQFDQVLYDNARVGAMAAEYLLGHGHRELMFVAGNTFHAAFNERGEEFVKAAKAAQARVLICHGTGKKVTPLVAAEITDTATRAVEMLLQASPRPTALFAASDDLMVALYNQLRQCGLEPGKEVELIGCNNDLTYMEQMHPRPATIDIKLDLVGERAVDQLLWRMAHPGETSQTDVLIKPELALAVR